MPISSSQHPSTRRDTLERLIDAAVSDGDSHRIRVLKSQWVHRYGLASLPAEGRPAPGPNTPETRLTVVASDASDNALQEHSVEEGINGLSVDELVPPAETTQAGLSPTAPAEQDSLAFEVVSDRADEAGFALDEAQPPMSDLEQQDTSSVLPMNSPQAATPPPLSTPRSLRRWLPGADSALPQAS